ncbi:hypothetical protein [Microcoleus vaginatus]|uniref:hypothetical protein n=1 Tax=Microcoleus vaginatus TaxID=119532 RepID=UPI00168A248C|nr:hypothetical protein [Microcoleus sp. FACHB-84]MBD2007793.1 hypothetical protein [Microcoleus sp. FACHB-45]
MESEKLTEQERQQKERDKTQAKSALLAQTEHALCVTRRDGLPAFEQQQQRHAPG